MYAQEQQPVWKSGSYRRPWPAWRSSRPTLHAWDRGPLNCKCNCKETKVSFDHTNLFDYLFFSRVKKKLNIIKIDWITITLLCRIGAADFYQEVVAASRKSRSPTGPGCRSLLNRWEISEKYTWMCAECLEKGLLCNCDILCPADILYTVQCTVLYMKKTYLCSGWTQPQDPLLPGANLVHYIPCGGPPSKVAIKFYTEVRLILVTVLSLLLTKPWDSLWL